MLMTTLIVSSGNSDNLCLPVFHGEYAWINGVGFFGLTNDQHLNSFRSGIGDMAVQFIHTLKLSRDTLCNWMRWIDDKVFYFLKLFVALATAAYIVQVVGGPVCPVVPHRGMEEQQPMPLLDEFGDRCLACCTDRLIVGQNQQISLFQVS